MRLVQFAFFNNDRLAELKELAAEEYWGDGNGRQYASLHYYCEANFEIAYAQKRIYIAPAERFAVWRIGTLISAKEGRPLYAYFTKNSRDNKQKYQVYRFLVGNWDGSLSIPREGNIPASDLPGEQVYAISQYQPDFRIEVDNWGHLLLEHEDRLRKVLPNVKQYRMLQLLLSGAFEEVQRLARFADKIIPQYFIPKFREFAPPPYHDGSYQFLAPLYLKEQPDTSKPPDLVAALEENAARSLYKVKTLLPPEWAYRTARCLAKDNTRFRSWITIPQSNGQQASGTATQQGKQQPRVAAPPKVVAKPPPVPTPAPAEPPEQPQTAAPPPPEPVVVPVALGQEVAPVQEEATTVLTQEHILKLVSQESDAAQSLIDDMRGPTVTKPVPGQEPGPDLTIDVEPPEPAINPADFSQAADNTPEQWLEFGNSAYKAGKFAEALKHYNLAIYVDPDFADAYSAKGDALRRLGKNTEALDAYRHAFRMDPSLAHAYLGAGRVYFTLGNFTKALIAFEEAIQQAPDDPFAYVFKSQALRNLKEPEDSEALKALDRATELNPGYAFAWHLKGDVLTRLGKLDDAQQAYQKAKDSGYIG